MSTVSITENRAGTTPFSTSTSTSETFEVQVIGAGTIGLPMGALLAAAGHEVAFCELSPRRRKALASLTLPRLEPELFALLEQLVPAGRLPAFATPRPAEVHLICVPTPIKREGRLPAPDLQAVTQAAHQLAGVLQRGNLVILESTVPIGATEKCLGDTLARLTGLLPGRDFDLCYCPERVLPGDVIREIRTNDRVIGGCTQQAALRAAALYSTVCEGELLISDVRTAEAVKLIENSFRDVNIAFANELAHLLPSLGVDARKAFELANHHPRVNIHQPGLGVGGHCLPVDPWFLIERKPDVAHLMHTARTINDAVPRRVARFVLGKLAGIANSRVALLGLAYKPDVDDWRESPALELAELLKVAGVELRLFDPFIKDVPGLLTSLEEAVEGANCCIIGAAHTVLRSLALEKVAKLMVQPLLIDPFGLFSQAQAAAAGIELHTLGRTDLESATTGRPFDEIASGEPVLRA